MKKLEGIRNVSKVLSLVAVAVVAKSAVNHYVPQDVLRFRHVFVTLVTVMVIDTAASIIFSYIDGEVDSAIKQAEDDAIGMVG